ncbi:MAG: glycosyltransferase family 4 protein [Bellilinea sp.]|jgi:hypothetical protein
MRILLVADGRSPITLRWLDSLRALDYRVSLISSFPCNPPEGMADFFYLPVAFSGWAGALPRRAAGHASPARPPGIKRRLVSTFRAALLAVRYRLAPLDLPARRYRALLERVQPDLVHALRIPFEGMLAAATPPEFPLALSIWGNDLTLHAAQSHAMARLTRAALTRADGLHVDALRDLNLAYAWGFPASRPSLVIPTNGGIDLRRMQSERQPLPAELESRIPPGLPLVINPRGVRAYTCTAAFFQSIPLILERRPQVAFVCPGMAGEREAETWQQRLRLDQRVTLLPALPQGQLWSLFARSQVSVSLTTHDGTPNTLLEAMACGSFPVAGDLESLREWITPGVNGLLVEAGEPQAVAAAVLDALDQPDLRSRAATFNLRLVEERAEVARVRPRLDTFYRQLIRV